MNIKRQPPFWIILLLLVRYLYKRLQLKILGVRNRHEVDIRGKTVVITGANTGLGRVTAIEMAKRGATIVMACRNIHLGEKAAAEIRRLAGNKTNIVLMELDLVSFTSVRRFCVGVKERFPTIDILINNAGIFDPSEEIKYTETGLEKHFAVNHLGHFLLTNLLMPKFNENSRIVTIGSTADFIEELQIHDLSFKSQNPRSGYGYLIGRIFGKAYAASKFANSLFSYELGQRLRVIGARSYTVCPGMVGGTDLFRYHNSIDRFICTFILKIIGLSPEQGVETILYCALSKLCENETGLYYQFSEVHPYENYRNSANADLAKKLWEESVKLVGL